MRFATMLVKVRDRWHARPGRPEPAPNHRTLAFLAQTNCREIAEIGCARGATSIELARWLNHEGTLHLFDYKDKVESVRDRIRAEGYTNVVIHGNSHRTLDSYNWSLMRLLQERPEPMFDYIYLDGAHTWGHDALAFLLADRLLRPGGFIDFDDYAWTHATSPSVNPTAWPKTREWFTDEQIATPQVKLIVELLVRRDNRYDEVVADKIFRKGLDRE